MLSLHSWSDDAPEHSKRNYIGIQVPSIDGWRRDATKGNV